MKETDKELWRVPPKMVEAVTEYLRRQIDDDYLTEICQEYQAKFREWLARPNWCPMKRKDLGKEVQPCCLHYWLCPNGTIRSLLPLKAHLRSPKHVAARMGVDSRLLKQAADSLNQPTGPRIGAIRNKDMRTCKACHLLDDCGNSCRCRCVRSGLWEQTGYWQSYATFLKTDPPEACPHRARHEVIRFAARRTA
jgi:hypothetical protein